MGLLITSGAKMPFQRFVEIGRIAVLTDGACAGKIAATVDVIDQNRVLVDGPCSGVERHEEKNQKPSFDAHKNDVPIQCSHKGGSKSMGSRKSCRKVGSIFLAQENGNEV